jgi:hypothetical protein
MMCACTESVPGAVRHLHTTSITSTSVDLRWDAPAGDVDITYYKLFYANLAERQNVETEIQVN